MADLNRFCFTGRLTADAVIKTLPKGTKLMEASVAVNTGFGDYKKTLFIKVQMWGERGEKVVHLFKKGSLVTADGEVSKQEWTAKDGTTRVDFTVDVMNMQLLASKQQNTNDSDLDAGGAAESDKLVF